MLGLFARHLYFRIWLAVLAGVAVVTFTAGWVWRSNYEQRMAPLPREVTLRDAQDRLIGHGQSLRTNRPGEAVAFTITLNNGERYVMQLGPRPDRPGAGLPPWSRSQWNIFWLLGLVGLATAIGLYPIVRRLTQRLETLQRSVQSFGEGDLSVRVQESGQDEVADLARHFNAAAARIEQLVRSHKSLLANASHELRSPLTRIHMALELMGERPSDATRHELKRNIAELDQLIDEILLASRLDLRETDSRVREPVDLMGLAAEECARVQAELELVPGTTLEALTVPGEPRLLRRALRNLLENARRHGRGPIEAELGTDGPLAIIRISDRGPGVPPDQCERIFEPFYRLPGASERDGGVGLGLALVKSIAERHAGSARCESREGGGARFVIALPNTV